MISPAFHRRLEAVAPVRTQEPLALYTTFRIGGPADAHIIARDAAQLQAALALAREFEVPVFILGAGSNLLVSDLGIRALVVENWAQEVKELGEAPHPISGEPATLFRVESGMPLPRLAYRMAREGWGGLEWAVGIPGTVGGGVVSNAGAHGGCMADLLCSVQVVHLNGDVQCWDVPQLRLGYRTSCFLEAQLGKEPVPTILSADIAPSAMPKAVLEERIAHYAARRRNSQPSQPSAGSVFKNPPGHAAWWLIEQVGLKGHRIGGAQVSDKHSNFIVNRGGARAGEVVELIHLIQERVRATFGICLEREIQLVGEGLPREAP